MANMTYLQIRPFSGFEGLPGEALNCPHIHKNANSPQYLEHIKTIGPLLD